jgi:hypothetical protein
VLRRNLWIVTGTVVLLAIFVQWFVEYNVAAKVLRGGLKDSDCESQTSDCQHSSSGFSRRGLACRNRINFCSDCTVSRLVRRTTEDRLSMPRAVCVRPPATAEVRIPPQSTGTRDPTVLRHSKQWQRAVFGQVLKSGGRSRCLNVLCQDPDTAPRTRLSRCNAPVDPEKQSFRRVAARAASERSGTSNAFSVIGSSVSGGLFTSPPA